MSNREPELDEPRSDEPLREDRDAIMSRRAFLVRTAMAGIASATVGIGASACSCLSPEPEDADEEADQTDDQQVEAQVCLSQLPPDVEEG